jgi:hypothetical protein
MTIQFYRPILLGFLGLGIVFSACTIATPVTHAKPTVTNKKRRYVPPKRAMPNSTEAGGTRSDICVSGQPDSQLTLLVPNHILAQTQTSHPTFSWHVQTNSSAAIPMRFVLIKPGQAEPVYQQTFQQQGSGLIQLQLPNNIPGLDLNQPYRWMVSISCGADRPSEQIYQRAWIERVPLSPAATQAITQATQDSDRLTIYAQDGIWYEAIAIAVAQQQNPTIQPLWQQLLADAQLDGQLNAPTDNVAKQP